MIFASVGTHPMAFDRLFRELDRLKSSGSIREEIIGQKGSGDFAPKTFACARVMKLEEFEKNIKKASMVVSHAGAGNIISALSEKKPLVVVPRLKKFGEHTNDHQLDLALALEKKGLCVAVRDIKDLGNAIRRAKALKGKGRREKSALKAVLRQFLLGLDA